MGIDCKVHEPGLKSDAIATSHPFSISSLPETYDFLPQDKPRSLLTQTEFFVNDINRVLNFTMDEVHDMYNSVWDKIKHNQETFFNGTKPLEKTKEDLLKVLG